MYINPLCMIDFYKVDHRRQYPEGTTEIYSNFTPRSAKNFKDLINGDIHSPYQIVFFGLQYVIHEMLINRWVDFFTFRGSYLIEEYKELVQRALGIENFDCEHLYKLRELGYLPIEIKALPEGFRVPIGVPVMTIKNTHPEFAWLTNYLESVISACLWKPITVATLAFEFKRKCNLYGEESGVTSDFIDFQVHDFSFRGMSGLTDAMVCGAAHLTCFKGSDCLPAIQFIHQYYPPENEATVISKSIPATEHSVMCCTGEDGEFDTIKRLITQVYPSGMVSIVCDSYNFWRVLTDYLPKLKDEINARDGKVVIRPDSGDPVDVVCGNFKSSEDSPQRKGALQLLWELFGGTENAKGFKELNQKIGLIYGDSITVKVASHILANLRYRGFSTNCIVLGVGSFTYQHITRDTLGFAMKATHAVIDGKDIPIYKDPFDDREDFYKTVKKSAKGYLKVQVDMENARFELLENVSREQEMEGELETVFKNGKIIKNYTIEDVRKNINFELDNL